MPIFPQQNTAPSISAKASQDFLQIVGIRDGIVIMKNGGLRTVLMCSSLNFALKAADEQDAITYQYQNFLNSLDFSLQIVIQSRKLNILPYLELLRKSAKDETNELLKIQIEEYIDFVKTFVDLSNIVSKTFYAIVPLDQWGAAKSLTGGPGIPGTTQIFRKKRAGDETKISATEEKFTEQKTQLLQRVDQVMLGLVRFGVRSVQLGTEELVELFYGLYNPGELEKKELPRE